MSRKPEAPMTAGIAGSIERAEKALEAKAELDRKLGKRSSTNAPVPAGFTKAVTVLIICTRSDLAAGPRFIFDTLKVLKGSGVRLFVAAPVEPPYAAEFNKLCDKFIAIPPREFSFRAFWRMRKTMKKYNVNVVHSHGRDAGVYSRLLGLTTKAAVLHCFHGVQSHETSLFDKLLSLLKYEPVYTSLQEKTVALRAGVSKKRKEPTIIEQCVDLDNYPPRPPMEGPFTAEKVRVGTILRGDKSRGPDAFLKIAAKGNQFLQFSCVGASRERLSHFGKVPSTIEFVGMLMDNAQWMYSLDVYVSTAKAEGQPIGVLEAMAAGCACVLSNIPAHQQFLQQQAALLFDPKEPESFMAALNDLKRDKGLRDSITNNARYFVERLHGLDRFRNKMIDVYRDAAKLTPL